MAFLVCLCALAWLLTSDFRQAHRFEQQLHQRVPLTDEELAALCFENGTLPDVVGRVRQVFAKHTGFPASKVHPDDDFQPFVNDLDSDQLLDALEKEFAVTISDADAASMRPTVRSASAVISQILQHNPRKL